MDWTGLLQWSIDQTKGNFNKDIKPMDEETKKWLAEAIETQFKDEIKRIKELLTEIAKPEQQDEEEKRLLLFEELEDLLDALDRANIFCKLDGLSVMLKYQNTTKFQSIRLQCLKIIGSSAQNNSEVQEWCGENGCFELLKQLDGVSLQIREQIMSALSSLIRGECLNNKRRFIDANGVQIILQQDQSNRCVEKTLNIIRDLVFYDDVLDRTYHDLSQFANTSGISGGMSKDKGYDLKMDVNAELQKNNYLEQNKKYKGIVKKMLINLDFYSYYDKFIQNTNYPQTDLRCAYFFILKELLKIEQNQNLVNKVQTHYEKLKSQNADETCPDELIICEQIL